MPLETVERCVERTIGERSKASNPQVDADSPALWQGRLDVALGLYRYELLLTELAHGDLLHLAQDLAAVSVAQPTELG